MYQGTHLTKSVPLATLVVSFCGTVLSSEFGNIKDDGLYDVVISRNRHSKPETGLESVIMYSKKGQPFRCSLPEVPKSVEEGDPLKDVTTEKIKYVLKNADEAKPSLCLRWLTQQWWHYEYCYSQKIIQFHLNEKGVMDPLISLGVFSHDKEWEEWTLVSRKEALKKKDRYHTQYFVNGSVCEETGKMRETTVKMYCDPATRDLPAAHDKITQLLEPEPCVYEMSVASRRMCQIPYFNVRPNTIGQIVCDPTDDVPQLHLSRRQEEVAEAAREEAELRNMMKDKSKTKMEVLNQESFYQAVQPKPTGAEPTIKFPSSSSLRASQQSKATTFQDVLSDMNPRVRQAKQLEKLIKDQFAALPGTFHVKILDDVGEPGGMPHLDPVEAQKIQDYLVNIFAKTLEQSHIQQTAVFELEQNYNGETSAENSWNIVDEDEEEEE